MCWGHRTSRGCPSWCRSDTGECWPRRSAFYRGAAAIMAADLADDRARGSGPSSAATRTCPTSASSRRRTGARLRRQRLRRDTAGAVRVGRQAARGQPGGRGARAAASTRRAPRDGRSAALREYRKAMREFAGMRDLDVWYTRLDVDGDPGALEPSVNKEQAARRFERERGQGTQQGQPAGALEAHRRGGRRPRIVSDPPLIVPIERFPAGETSASKPTVGRWSAATARRLLADRRMLLDELPLRARGPQGRGRGQRRARGPGSSYCSGATRTTRCSCRSRRRRRSVLEPTPTRAGSSTRASGWSRASD